jgi:hypothetical protein
VPVDTGPLVGDRSAAGRIIGRSPSTVKRLEKSDPDWPVPFSVGGPACNNYFLDYVRQYALRKAARAAAARAAKAAAAQDAKGVASMQTSTPVFPQKDRAEQQPERGIRANQSRPAKTPAETA